MAGLHLLIPDLRNDAETVWVGSAYVQEWVSNVWYTPFLSTVGEQCLVHTVSPSEQSAESFLSHASSDELSAQS